MVDGSEDSLIYCTKPGEIAANAAAEISAEIATLLQEDEDNFDVDPFASNKEFEEDETVIDVK